MAKASVIPEYQYEYSKISTKTPVKRKRRKSMRGLIAACLAAIMSLAAAGLMVKGLFVRIELAEQSDKIIAAKQELSRIEEENRLTEQIFAQAKIKPDGHNGYIWARDLAKHGRKAARQNR